MKASVLVVEDDEKLRQFLSTVLSGSAYRVLEAPSMRAARLLAEQYVPDLYIVDLGLPDGDGLSLVRELRTWSKAPVLVISARGQEAQKVAVLDAGADDYLTKPFGFAELMARLRALLRRAQTPQTAESSGQFRCGPLTLDVGSRQAKVDEKEVRLTPIEWKLLLVLAQQSGRIVTQAQLLLEVWGPHRAENSNYLRVYVTHLRRKLGPAAAILRTEAGIGYGLSCPDALAPQPPAP